MVVPDGWVSGGHLDRRNAWNLRDLRSVQPAPLLPAIEPHPIVVLAGGATHPVAFACHYAPNLAASAKDITGLRINSWIAVGYDNVHRIPVHERVSVCGRIARRKRVFQCLVDCLLRANLFFGAKPIVER